MCWLSPPLPSSDIAYDLCSKECVKRGEERKLSKQSMQERKKEKQIGYATEAREGKEERRGERVREEEENKRGRRD